MVGHAGLPVPEHLVQPRLWVSDVVYFPLETELVTLARARGCRVVPGGGMGRPAGRRCLRVFTGRPADAARVARHFEEMTA